MTTYECNCDKGKPAFRAYVVVISFINVLKLLGKIAFVTLFENYVPAIIFGIDLTNE